MCDIAGQLQYLSRNSELIEGDFFKNSGQLQIRTSNFYSREKIQSLATMKKGTQKTSPVPSVQISHSDRKEIKTDSKGVLKSSKRSSNNIRTTSLPAEKAVQNAFEENNIFFAEKAKDSSCDRASDESMFGKIFSIKDVSRKRVFPDTPENRISQLRQLHKKQKLDVNMNVKTILDWVSHEETGGECLSDPNTDNVLLKRTKTPDFYEENFTSCGSGMKSDMMKTDSGTGKKHHSSFTDIKLSFENSKSHKKGTPHKNRCSSEQDTFSISEEFSPEKHFEKLASSSYSKLGVQKQKTLADGKQASGTLKLEVTRKQDKEREWYIQETCSVLKESSQDNNSKVKPSSSSSLLSSPTSSSSGFTNSSCNAPACSPDNQSTITRYFAPVKGENWSSQLKTIDISPPADKKRKGSVRAKKDNSPVSPPVSSKREQMYLDLGQKDFGHVTCPTCNMVYTRAQPEDEAYHLKFHKKFVSGLRFQGWKTERVLEHYDDGRVIVVLPQDHFMHLKKVTDVRNVVDNELGFSSESSFRMQDAQTYLFITNKRVVGCVVAVDIEQAYPVLPCAQKDEKQTAEMPGAWCCSSTPVRAQCGISRVWVLKQYRRQRIASQLLDCVRKHFIFGCVITKETLAFSDPTPHGKQLAEAYCGTESFLVFR